MGTSSSSENWIWARATIAAISSAAAAAAISSYTLIFIFLYVNLISKWHLIWSSPVYIYKKKSNDLQEKIKELQISLQSSIQKCAAERKGRTRAEQAVRRSLTQNNDKSKKMAYPMTPIAVIQSCFSTRYGTPRQPLLVPLARACLVFDTSVVPPAALEGLSEYSHCWIIYVFHLNTDLEKLWKPPANSKFKAKVRVPKLKGGRMGVFATRSPHRPCPIGLTLAKVEAVQGHTVLLSGVDLVDGTPILDIKPYLPYCESLTGATVPKWVEEDNLLAASVDFSPEFFPSLSNCWATAEKRSLYASPSEVQSLIKQVLTWDIRSLSQHIRPHSVFLKTDNKSNSDNEEEVPVLEQEKESPFSSSSTDVVYHLMLEDFDISYKINSDGNVIVNKTIISTDLQKRRNRCSYTMWKETLG